MSDRMSPEKIEEILARRAERIAAAATGDTVESLAFNVAVVGVGPEKIGIPVDGLVVIARTPSIAHLPKMPQAIRGIVQIRGDLIGVIDIARWFGISSGTSGQLLAVVEGSPGKLGILVDSVLGFRDVVTEDIVDTLCDDTGSSRHPIQATTRDLIAILDLDKLFHCSEIGVDFRGAQERPDTIGPGSGMDRPLNKEDSK